MIHLVHINDITLKRTYGCGTSLHLYYGEIELHSQDYKNLSEWVISFTSATKQVEIRQYLPSNNKRELWNAHKFSLTRKTISFKFESAAKKNNLDYHWLLLVSKARIFKIDYLKSISHIFLVYDDNTKDLAEIYQAYLNWYLTLA